ncbi:MAG: hypothetical protein WCL08_13105, partial [Verrucomicrobiota bacterium]
MSLSKMRIAIHEHFYPREVAVPGADHDCEVTIVDDGDEIRNMSQPQRSGQAFSQEQASKPVQYQVPSLEQPPLHESYSSQGQSPSIMQRREPPSYGHPG